LSLALSAPTFARLRQRASIEVYAKAAGYEIVDTFSIRQ
jgi:hypothetical protein